MAGFLPPHILEQIRAASDIVDIVGGYLPLKRAGANFVALCPFHKEKSPSFNVNPHRQIFHCFGCHKGGDVFTFVKEYENIGFMDAVRRLAERAKIPLEFDNNPAQQQVRHVKDTLLHIHEQITQRWQAALANDANGQIARDYLQKRGVTEDAVKLFRLGYAPDVWDDTVNWAKSKNFDLALVEQAGLILKKDGGGYYDRFRGRLMFPICDEQGRVIAFSGRILSGDEKTAKYVNSPETPIFTKGKIFFGLDKSKRALLDSKFAVVCEGQLDLMACYMAGIKNMVAPQGTALTPDHARILKRYVEEVVLCFDSDNAGQNATVRSLDSLLAAGLAVRVATVPPPHDPDSFIKENGADAFQRLLEKAEGFFDYHLNRLCATNDVNTDKGRVAIVKSMGENLRKTDNTVLMDKYAQKTAMRLGVAAESVRREFKKAGRPERVEEEVVPQEEEAMVRPPITEIWLLKALLQTDELVEWINAFLDLNWLTSPLTSSIVEQRLEKMQNEAWFGVAAWLGELESVEMRSFITELLADERPPGELAKILQGEPGKKGVVELLRDKYVDRQLASINQRLADPGLDHEQAIGLTQQKLSLRQLKQTPLVPKGE